MMPYLLFELQREVGEAIKMCCHCARDVDSYWALSTFELDRLD